MSEGANSMNHRDKCHEDVVECWMHVMFHNLLTRAGSWILGIYRCRRGTTRNSGTWSGKWVLKWLHVSKFEETKTWAHIYAFDSTWSWSIAVQNDTVESQPAWLGNYRKRTCKRWRMAQSVGPAKPFPLDQPLDSKKAGKMTMSIMI